jgi:molecular chaperone HtpG
MFREVLAMTPTVETHPFQTETAQLLDLMIHSVYSNRDIFLRELISNASDALDKLRFEALTHPELAALTTDPHIRIEADPKERTLSVSDNGIGMSHDEIIQYIGTIAKSGSVEYLRSLREAEDRKLQPELIGRFGVGFYSSFMAAERVTLTTRRAGEETAWKWESGGAGSYTLEPAVRDTPGTTVTLHLRPKEEGEHAADYTDEWTLRSIVKKYSDFVAYPIRMRTERREIERGNDGKPKPGAAEKTIVEDVVLNSMKAIWTRPEAEVTDTEYKEFYKHISHDWNEPLHRILLKAEGTSEFRALLFIPSKAPFDLFVGEGDLGVHLYVRRVFILHDCKELIPGYLRFLRGVVDSEDLSLNISRELLQQNRQIAQIRNGVVRKVLDTLKTLRTDAKDTYRTFWREFGRVFKEGLLQDTRNRETLLDLCWFHSTKAMDEECSLDDYIERMPKEQEAIYYMTGASLRALEASPHLEVFRRKGYEVLLLTDPIDELWVQSVPEYKGKKMIAAGKGEVELGSEDERREAAEGRKEREADFKPLLDWMAGRLEDRIKEVRLSTRLTESPACLVGDAFDLSPQLEQLLRASGREMPPVKRILEINPEHPMLNKLRTLHAEHRDEERLTDFAELLYGQALLAEGSPLPDPAGFGRRLARWMTSALDTPE